MLKNNLYLVKRTDGFDYDQTQVVVLVAASLEHAIELSKFDALAKPTAEFIGMTDKPVGEIIIEDFNAG